MLDIQDAINCLWYWKYRTLLSALGIAIGTAALIVMLSISEGAREVAQKNIEQLGVKSIRLETKNEVKIKLSQSENLAKGLTTDDLIKIRQTYPNANIGSFYFVPNQSVLVNEKLSSADILFVNLNWFDAENISLQSGRKFLNTDITGFKQVCIVGSAFGKGNNSNGDVVSWQGNSCQKVGVISQNIKRVLENSLVSQIDLNHSIIMPLESRNDLQKLSGITVRLSDQTALEEVINQSEKINNLLSQSHVVEDYQVIVPATLLEKAAQERRTFNLIMGTIAGLSLLVGGIGILNVMLAKVAEQTREVGLRKTLGANTNRIFQLFMLYSIMLSVSGTIIGVCLGFALTLLIQWLAEWPVLFSIFSLSIGPLFSIVLGAIFGLYPAMRASRLSPLVALRLQ